MSKLLRLIQSTYRFARAEFAVLAALLVIGGGGLLFIELVDEIEEGESLELDRAILRMLRSPGDPAVPLGPEWLATAMVDLTSLGSTTVLSLMTVLTTVFLFLSRKFTAAWLTPVSVGGAALAMTALKHIFERPRPDVVPHLVEVSSMSFPSGHTMVATAAYLTLAVIVAETSKPRRSV